MWSSLNSGILNIILMISNNSTLSAHEDFIITCGQAYFLSFVMEKFQMEDLNSKPSHPLLPENVKMQHQPSKEKVFFQKLWMILSVQSLNLSNYRYQQLFTVN